MMKILATLTAQLSLARDVQKKNCSIITATIQVLIQGIHQTHGITNSNRSSAALQIMVQETQHARCKTVQDDLSISQQIEAKPGNYRKWLTQPISLPRNIRCPPK